MSLDSFVNRPNNTKERDFKDFVHKLSITIESLGAFKGKEGKKLNLSKLSEYLNLSKSELEELIDLILQFQEMFEHVFIDYIIRKKTQNGAIYFTLERRETVDNPQNSYQEIEVPDKIQLNPHQINHLSDIIYLFQFIKKGKGFDLNEKSSELLDNLKRLMETHSYLFYKNGGDLLYPTALCLEFGNRILSYNKSNKQLTDLQIDTHTFEVK